MGSESLTPERPDLYPESIRYIMKYGLVVGEGVGNDYYSISWSDLQSFADNDFHNEIIYFSFKRATDLFNRGVIDQSRLEMQVHGLYETLQNSLELSRQQQPNQAFTRWADDQISLPVGSSPEEEYCKVQKLKIVSYIGPKAYFRRLNELPAEFHTHNGNSDLHPVLVANSMYLGVSAWVRNLAATGQSFSMLDPKTSLCYCVSASDGRLQVDWGRIAGGDSSLYPVIIDDIYRTGKSVEKTEEILSEHGFSVGVTRYLTGFTLPT